MAAQISLLPLFDTPVGEARASCAGALRRAWRSGAADVLLDVDQAADARCLQLRLGDTTGSLTLILDDCVAVQAAGAGGWLLARRTASQRRFWLPRAPTVRRLDAHARICSDDPADVLALDLDGQRAGITLRIPDGSVVDLVLWDLPAPVADELLQLMPPEDQGLFLWGSHTVYRRPADVYRHLAHGHVYEDRYEWPLRRKTPSENDAHALSVCLGGLAAASGKQIYRVLRRQLLLAVLDRQDADGGFRHGEWTEFRESHFRLHASAMHLMMDALTEHRDDDAVRAALGRAMDFATRQHDQTALGAWFLHDELELSAAGMDAGPFKWIPSTVCGKSPTNMLVLNSHLDTLVALLRYRELCGDTRYDALADSARRAAHEVLALRPMEWLYAAMFRLFGLVFLPTRRAAALPLHLRALKRVAWRWLLPWLPRMKARWPRLVMPGGYVDRDLSLRTWSHRYLTVNAMDLARMARRAPDDPLYLAVLAEALRFTERSGIAEKWREKAADQYSIGFLVDALYQMCTLSPDWAWRTQLAAQVLVSQALDLGLTPSVLGQNREIAASAGDFPRVADPRLRTLLIRCADGDEVMVINTSAEPVVLTWDRATRALHWLDAQGTPVADEVALPAHGWRLGRPA